MYKEIYNQLKNEAAKKNLKESTIHAYYTSVLHFLNYTGKSVSELNLDDVDDFLSYKRLSGISAETYNHYHSGIRFFYKKILKRNWNDDDISRTNKTIHIRNSKSRSDRYTLLADRTLDLLTAYWFQCGKPRDILFPSSRTGSYLVRDSVIQFFRESAQKAGIARRVSTHSLRHSFASHLFEAGYDIKYIQALLGHRDPRSTELYLHLSNKALLGIKSPFDEMAGD